MKNRRDRLARAVAIGDKLWRLQQMRLAQAESALAALRAAEAAAFESLGQIEPSVILPYIADLSKRRLEAEALLLEARARAREYGRRMKLTQKLHKEADEVAHRDEAAAQLRRLTERDESAPGKFA